MASTGYKTAGSGTNVDNAQEIWLNPGNITLGDDVGATADIAGNNTSDSLTGQNFGFNIPSGSTIDGVEVKCRVKRIGAAGSGSGNLYISYVRVVDNNGVLTARTAPTYDSWSTNYSDKIVGGPSEKFGQNMTASYVNDPNFGIAISVNNNGMVGSYGADVDHMEINVFYTIVTFNPAFAHRRLLL